MVEALSNTLLAEKQGNGTKILDEVSEATYCLFPDA